MDEQFQPGHRKALALAAQEAGIRYAECGFYQMPPVKLLRTIINISG